MSVYRPELHPEFSDRWRKTADLPRAREADYQDALNIFRADVARRLGVADSAPESRWMMFVFGNETVHPDSSGGEADLLIMRTMGEIDTESGAVTHPYVRLLYSEKYDVPNGRDFFTIDVTIDDEDDAQFLVGTHPMLSNPDIDSINSTVPVAIVTKEHGLVLSMNFMPFTHMPDLFDESSDEMLVPFGQYFFPTDKQQALEKAAMLLSLVADRMPTFSGETYICAEME